MELSNESTNLLNKLQASANPSDSQPSNNLASSFARKYSPKGIIQRTVSPFRILSSTTYAEDDTMNDKSQLCTCESCNCRCHNSKTKRIHQGSILSDNESNYAPTMDSENSNADCVDDSQFHYSTPTSSSVSFKELLPYYLPCVSWIPFYCWSYFVGDFISGLSLVFFQLPLSLSYASIAHVPVLSGLFSLAISPLIYGIFGSVPQMIVGPEAAISLVVGQAIEPFLSHNSDINPIDLVVAITSVSGLTLFCFGIGRFGYLDNVLSSSLLKGFISAVGVVMVINSLVTEMGLSIDPASHVHSPIDKLKFLIDSRANLHQLTSVISLVSFLTLLLLRNIKKQFKNASYEKVVFLPEILIVTVISIVLSKVFKWDESGVQVVGEIDPGSLKLTVPFTPRLWPLTKQLTGSGFLAAMLGFFESTTASKSLGSRYNLPISSNRELIALGSINLVGSAFGALPAFGGYGRSKINAISAKTCASGIFMGLFTLITIYSLLDYIYYLPKCILAVITSIIGISLLDEAPSDLLFHWRARGWNELITFFVTVIATIFFSVEAGIALGIGYSLIRVIKHSASSRIQILGRVPNTNSFVNADYPVDNLAGEHLTVVNSELEEVEGCLIVKIPEPLTFTNTTDLKARLRRVELYGSTNVHPGLPRTRSELMTRYVIFDLHGMTELDSSAAQILKEILESYRDRGMNVFFTRVSTHTGLIGRLQRTGITDFLRRNLEDMHQPRSDSVPFFRSVSDALRVVDDIEMRHV